MTRTAARRRAAAVLFVALLVLPAALSVATAQRGPPLMPDTPEEFRRPFNSTWENATRTARQYTGVTPVVFHEGFEGPATLVERGWREEVLGRRTDPVWKALQANFSMRQESATPILVPDGDGVATVAGPSGAYEPFRDVRLVTPVIDLRYVLGASQDVDATGDRKVGGQPTLNQLAKDYDEEVAKRRFSSSMTSDLQWTGTEMRKQPSGRGLVDEREGAGLVNLTFQHAWDLAQGDYAWLEVRWRENGTWTSWTPLEGDLVFETEVDYATIYQLSPFCEFVRGEPGVWSRQVRSSSSGAWQQAARFCTERINIEPAQLWDLGPLSVPDAVPRPPNFFIFGDGYVTGRDGRIGPDVFGFGEFRSVFPVTVSQLLKFVLDQELPAPAYYNGAFDNGPGEPQTRAWVDASKQFDQRSYIVRDAHFTLNKFIGQEIEIGFRFRSGPAVQSEFGWYVDDVRVTASSVEHDPAVNGIVSPPSGDVLAGDTRLRPVALIANNGRLDVRDVNVTFRVTDRAETQTFLEETVYLPRLAPLEKRNVGTNALTPALRNGEYLLHVEVASSNVKGTTLQADQNRRNNVLTSAFSVETVLDIRVGVSVPTAAVMTDREEAKDGIEISVENLGNTNTTGMLNVTVHSVNETSGLAGPPLEILLLETLLPADIPYGKGLDSRGADEGRAVRKVSWTGRDTGLYVVRARFVDASGVTFDAPDTPLYVRQTPLAAFGPLDFAHDLARLPVFDVKERDVEQLGWRTWGYSGIVLGQNQGFLYNACGTQAGTLNTPSYRAPPLCPLPLTLGNLGTATGAWTWVATHDDYIVRQDSAHGTNIFDEGILEHVRTLDPADLRSDSDRMYLTFRHWSAFNWGRDAALNAADPLAFRGQFRLTTGDSLNLPQREFAGREVDRDRTLLVVNFTDRVSWERAVLDLTPLVRSLDKPTPVRMQWVLQSTPANLVPDWRTGSGAQDRQSTGASTSECASLQQTGACTLHDPLGRWAVDEISLFVAPPSSSPRPRQALLWSNGAETANSAKDFTGCFENLNGPKTASNSPPEGQHRGDAPQQIGQAQQRDAFLESKCRQWERYNSRLFPSLWYLERIDNVGPPTNDPEDRTYWLRWGNHDGKMNDNHVDPTYMGTGIYGVAETPPFDFRGAQQPVLAFDHWHEFQQTAYAGTHPTDPSQRVEFATEGGNVWLKALDRDGKLAFRHLLTPDSSSPSRYTLPVWPEPNAGPVAGLRGAEPMWTMNYSRMKGEPAVFARASGGGTEGVWTQAKFDLGRYTAPEYQDLTFVVEFHAFLVGLNGASSLSGSKGWRVDNVEIREAMLANDVALASIESPPSLVGPGVTQPVVVRVRNDGAFPQRGVAVEYVVTRPDGSVVAGPFQARLPYGSEADALPGLRDTSRLDKNVTFPFNVSWTPQEEGAFVLEARVVLEDSLEPFRDENAANDVLRRNIVVQERHDVFVHGPARMDDEAVVSPYIGPVGVPRTLTVVVENNGTVPERFLGQDEGLLRVEIDIFGEDGRSVLPQPFRQSIRELVPGQRSTLEFRNAWQPTRSGVYDVVIDVVYPTEQDGTSKDDTRDNRRIVKVLVFDVLMPARGKNLTTEFQPDDVTLWGHNATRYATSDGWSFPPAEREYPDGVDTSLVLLNPMNLRSVRSAYVLLNHSFDFERAYDGARLEVSLDGGETWEPLAPQELGGWDRLSTASPYVEDPYEETFSFTGQGQGVWRFNLGDVSGLHTTAVLLEDDFEQRGLPQLRANLTLGEPPKPRPPTPIGFTATVTPDLHDRARNALAVKVEANGPIRQIDAFLNGRLIETKAGGFVRDTTWSLTQCRAPPSDGLWTVTLPVDPLVGTDRTAARDLPYFLDGSVLTVRVYPWVFGIDNANLDLQNIAWPTSPCNSVANKPEPAPPTVKYLATLPHVSPTFVLTPSVGAEVVDAAREQLFRVGTGAPFLWSDHAAVVCGDNRRTLDMGDWPVDGQPYLVPEDNSSWPCKVNTAADKPNKVGATRTTKYLETSVDLREARGAGELRVEIRDFGGIPRQFWKTFLGVGVPEPQQTVRVVFESVPTNGDPPVVLTRDLLSSEGQPRDEYWNWTNRVVVVQGQDWNRLAGQVVKVRLEHVVFAAFGGSNANWIGGSWDNSIHPRSTDEYGPHFGWGIASARVSVSGGGLNLAPITLDPASVGSTQGLAAHGWVQGAVSERFPDPITRPGDSYRLRYRGFTDLFTLQEDPFAKSLWQFQGRVEMQRPRDGVLAPNVPALLNHYWEANASRYQAAGRAFEQGGGAARLVMPLDLKSAVGQTWLTFNTMYHFHQATLGTTTGGTSGGRVEISVDGGLTWQPVVPSDPHARGVPTMPPHAHQTTTDGSPFVPRATSSFYRLMFWDENFGMGAASRFAPDPVILTGRPSEFGSAPNTHAFVGNTPAGTSGTDVFYRDSTGKEIGRLKVKTWVPVAVDLTPYAGRDVLVAFHADFTTGRVASNTLDAPLQNFHDYWRIDDLRVTAEIFRGADVLLRLRAASDANVAGSGWDIREVQVISQKHLLNLGARILEPTTDDWLRVGENALAIEVANKGLVAITGARVNVWINTTGANAPPSRVWTGPLGSFVGCRGESVPPDSRLAPEQSVRICGHADGDLVVPGSPGVDYHIEVIVDHDAFLDELLVGDNRVVRRLTRDQIILDDHIVVDRLVVRPSLQRRGDEQDVTVSATLRLVGFDRADVATATLVLAGDPDRPVTRTLADARSFDPRFTSPGETRDLEWVIERSTLRELKEGPYVASVKVATSHPTKDLVSTRTAPLLIAAGIKAELGFLYHERVRQPPTTIRQAFVPDTQEDDTHVDQIQFARQQCPSDSRMEPYAWCSYHHQWNESKSSPNPTVNQEPDAERHWRVGTVLDMSGLSDDEIPPSAKARQLVLELRGFQAQPVQTSGQNAKSSFEHRAVSLESPVIDIGRMRGENGLPRVGLSFLQRYDLGVEGAFAKVFVAPWNEVPVDERSSRTQSPILVDERSDNEWHEVGRFAGMSKGYADFEFESFTADLTAAIERNNTRGVTYEKIKVRMVLYLPIHSRFQQWQIDDVIVGPFAGTLGPSQDFPLNDDSDKTYAFVLRNGGAYSDVYNVSLRESTGKRVELPSGWNVTVLDEDGAILDQLGAPPGPSVKCERIDGARRDLIDLGSGDERKIRLKLCIPVGTGSPGQQGFSAIALTAFSQNIRELTSGASLDVDYAYLNRPNLRVLNVRSGADLPVDQPRQVIVEAQNTGTQAACDGVVRLLATKDGEPPQTVYNAQGAEPGVGSCRLRPDGLLEGGLAPGESRQFRFIWTPRHTGWHNLTAVADPENRISELSKDDNTLAVPVLIRLPSFPDLAVRVSVSTEEPNIGDTVNISAAITNLGGISAQTVNVTLRAGVTDLLGRGPLNENIVPRIQPGETVTINKTWRAVFPGKVLLYVNALPRDGVLERVETQGDNLVVLPLFVRSQGLDVSAAVVGVSARPGDAREVPFVIMNNGDTPDGYHLTVDAPKGVRAGIFHDGRRIDSIGLANHTSANLTVLLDLPARMDAGNHTLGLRAVSQNTSQTRVAQFTLDVRPQYGLFLEAAQAASRPGRIVVPLSLTNLGNAHDPIRIEGVDVPPGWKAVANDDRILPYARETVELVLDVPTATPRGIYEVLARVVNRHGVEARAVVGVTILDYQVAEPSFLAPDVLVRPQTLVPATVLLRNSGNVRAETTLLADGPASWTLELDRPALVLEPGETAEVGLRVLVPENAAFGKGVVRVVSQSGDVGRTALLNVTVAGSDLHVMELEYTPRVGVTHGSAVNFTAVVRNDGLIGVEEVGMAFYVNDLLVGYETLRDVPAGGERTVSFRWTAVGGEHVVLAILDPGNEVRETDEANNARLEIVRVSRQVGVLSAAQEAVPGPSLGLLALVLVGAALLGARARGPTSAQKKQ